MDNITNKRVLVLMIGCFISVTLSMPCDGPLPLFEKNTINHIKDSKDKYVATKKLEQNTLLTTSSGCTFTAETGWFVTQYENMLVLEEPNHELTVTLIENREKAAEQAVISAWKQAQPNFTYTLKHTMNSVPQDGWDEIVQYMYDASSTQMKLFVFATARRVGLTWYIELVEGTKAALDRRMSGVLLISTSFKVPGAQEESFAAKKAHTLNAMLLKEFISFVEQARVACEIPGLAIGIVQDGKLILEQGFGICELGRKDIITPNTLFMIGSTTKALTTFMMACLVDEGKFSWETPAVQIMPNFALGDATTTRQVLMKYTVSASTGIPRQDIETLFNYGQATPELRIKEMSGIKPTTGFGETFQYSNGMVSAGGYIAAHSVDKSKSLGETYDAVMQSRVFDPMNMKSTTFDFSRVENTDHAAPHGTNLHGVYEPMSIDNEKWVKSLRPAGGAWSNVHDMAQYMITELNNGVTAQGKRVISKNNLFIRREPQIQVTDKISYGLGLMIENDHGVLVVEHGGMTLGFFSLMSFLPEHRTGLVALTNARNASIFMQGVKRKFMELLFDGKPQAWDIVKMGVDQQKQMFEKNKKDILFKPNKAWLNQFIGIYTQPALGQIEIRETTDGAVFDAHLWKSSIGQKQELNGSLKLILTDTPFAGLEFLPQQYDGPTQLILESGQHKYIFERKVLK